VTSASRLIGQRSAKLVSKASPKTGACRSLVFLFDLFYVNENKLNVFVAFNLKKLEHQIKLKLLELESKIISGVVSVLAGLFQFKTRNIFLAGSADLCLLVFRNFTTVLTGLFASC